LYPTSSTGVGASADNKQYFAPLPEFGAYTSTGRNVVFALDDDYELYGVGTGSFLSSSNVVPTVYDAVNEPTYIKMRKFVFGFQGGFDGQSPAIPINVGGDIAPGNTQGLDCTTVNSAGSIAYNQAITSLGNADEFDINLIVVPGILHQHHPYVTNLVVDMCENRGDCFYIMDSYSDDGNPTAGQIDEVVSYAAQYDTSYAATYYPWVKILDTYNNKIVTVPPSVVMPSVYASNDKVAAEWFAPAGLNRGGIAIATQVTDRTTHEERDTLYEGKVNPIASFPGSGVVVWGQKTLQNESSALDRVSVRRLMIAIKKYFASTSKYLVFEQNVAATRNKFLSIVNPYLESVQQRSGLYAFFVKMDETNNTPDIIDRNILYGQIYLKPTKTAEFIVLDFNILPTGASFPNA
jgi:phage tail sheath protein FI